MYLSFFSRLYLGVKLCKFIFLTFICRWLFSYSLHYCLSETNLSKMETDIWVWEKPSNRETTISFTFVRQCQWSQCGTFLFWTSAEISNQFSESKKIFMPCKFDYPCLICDVISSLDMGGRNQTWNHQRWVWKTRGFTYSLWFLIHVRHVPWVPISKFKDSIKYKSQVRNYKLWVTLPYEVPS